MRFSTTSLVFALCGLLGLGASGVATTRWVQAESGLSGRSQPGGAPWRQAQMPHAGGMDQAGDGEGDRPHHAMMMVDSEFNYLGHMIPHHQEAVDTAQIILAKSDRPEMREFATAIIAAQTAEINQMTQWLADWYPDQTYTAEYEPMMRDLTTLEGDRLDQVFLEDMIMHHQMAVMTSNQLLHHNLAKNDEVQVLAQNIVATQRQEIDQMQTWLADWFGVEPGMPGAHGGMDHSEMNHGGMNHGGMNHGEMNHGEMNHGGMNH